MVVMKEEVSIARRPFRRTHTDRGWRRRTERALAPCACVCASKRQKGAPAAPQSLVALVRP